MPAADTLLKVRIWVKVVLLSLVGIYTLLFIFLNARQEIGMWLFFGVRPTVNVLVALLCAFLLGSLLTLLARTLATTVRQVRDSRERARTQRLEREVADMRVKAAKTGK